ncbi:hypothetical protein FACS1894193_00570 [Bacilli bacterium]|nr:hypothetical protein FACS1894193_00570 [Bacilli bacterium]
MKWRNTSVSLEQNSDIASYIINSKIDKSYFVQDDENNELTVKNKTNIFFYEIDYLKMVHKDRFFTDIVEKFQDKITQCNIKIFDEEKITFRDELISFNENEKVLCSEIILSNSITTSLDKEKISKVSPNIFEMLEQFYELTPGDKRIVRYYKNLFSLIFLCESTNISGSEFTFEFSKKEQTQFKITKGTNFNEDIYFSIYKWIIKKCDKIVKIENLLKIVRELLSRKKFEDISIEVIEQLETAYNQAVSADIDKYFLSQEKLKDEFTALTKLEFEDKRKLQYEILGLLVALSSGIYAIISKIENIDINLKNVFENKSFFNNFSVPFSIKILLFSSLITIFYFDFVFFHDIRMRKKLYEKIKKIYLDKLNFSNKEIEYYLEKPKIFKGNVFEWIILGLFSIVLIYFIVLG